ncbi:MAG: hypothetical protein ACI3WR_06715 [Oscillospiraceae bacterium]
MRRRRLGRCFAALALFLLLALLAGTRPRDGSGYSRRVEEDLFSLGMERLSGTAAESFFLREGDAIRVSSVLLSGEFTLSIGQEGREPIYEGRAPGPGTFQVTVPEDGDYLLSVSGKRAEGSVSFQISRAAVGR